MGYVLLLVNFGQGKTSVTYVRSSASACHACFAFFPFFLVEVLQGFLGGTSVCFQRLCSVFAYWWHSHFIFVLNYENRFKKSAQLQKKTLS